MKTIITVIFAGILTYTGAQNTGCRLPDGLHAMGRVEFNINYFFTGSWYVTHMKDPSNSYDAACREYKTYLKDRQMKLDAEGDYTIKGTTEHYTTTCSRGIEGIQHGSIPLTCMHRYENGDTVKYISFDQLWTIIDTNYQDYALAYRCTRYSGGSIHSGNLVLLQRNKKDDGSTATSRLASHNLKLSDFTNLNC
uniref:Salivary lipocalin n=1 Tax=Triatoma matogrossensis TaxID=162370 RepID=E2J763_9HEMI